MILTQCLTVKGSSNLVYDTVCDACPQPKPGCVRQKWTLNVSLHSFSMIDLNLVNIFIERHFILLS